LKLKANLPIRNVFLLNINTERGDAKIFRYRKLIEIMVYKVKNAVFYPYTGYRRFQGALCLSW